MWFFLSFIKHVLKQPRVDPCKIWFTLQSHFCKIFEVIWKKIYIIWYIWKNSYISTSFLLLSSKQIQDPSHVQFVISVHKQTCTSPRNDKLPWWSKQGMILEDLLRYYERHYLNIFGFCRYTEHRFSAEFKHLLCFLQHKNMIHLQFSFLQFCFHFYSFSVKYSPRISK